MKSSMKARRVADVPLAVREALENGTRQTTTLTEVLALDMARLMQAVFPDAEREVLDSLCSDAGAGVLKRMSEAGASVWARYGQRGLERCSAHPSDTVRGWACFMIGRRDDLSLDERLAHIRPLADDAHFGVREWAWMAMRAPLAADLRAGIARLAQWTGCPSERLRRFASEALRPRGVWCAHIPELKRDPALGLPILTSLRADPAPYVQDSVGNWLNDAAKSRPDWVRALCSDWLQGQPAAATRRICDRALRNLD